MKTAVLAVLAVVAAIAYWLWMTVSNRKGKKLPPGNHEFLEVRHIVGLELRTCTHLISLDSSRTVPVATCWKHGANGNG